MVESETLTQTWAVRRPSPHPCWRAAPGSGSGSDPVWWAGPNWRRRTFAGRPCAAARIGAVLSTTGSCSRTSYRVTEWTSGTLWCRNDHCNTVNSVSGIFFFPRRLTIQFETNKGYKMDDKNITQRTLVKNYCANKFHRKPDFRESSN